jgi:hypothetical protein
MHILDLVQWDFSPWFLRGEEDSKQVDYGRPICSGAKLTITKTILKEIFGEAEASLNKCNSVLLG